MKSPALKGRVSGRKEQHMQRLETQPEHDGLEEPGVDLYPNFPPRGLQEALGNSVKFCSHLACPHPPREV